MTESAESDVLANAVIPTRREAAEGYLRDLLNRRRALRQVVNWSRKWSLFQYPFVTACCGMEYMAVWGPRHDIGRFGAEFPRFTPRQSDLLFVVGTVTHKQAPVLLRTWEQMADPKWVVAFGVCASSGGFYNNYSVVQGIDNIIPVDVYIPGCPPRPEAVLDALMLLQEKITREQPAIV
ncbi:MAG: NADH-quinone oxidoreductase subunit B [Deltaproteobacteria bacterium]|nr:NADH-quinone oxidoreductase subunit B [Deltaproteobacteria bacterium]